MTILTHLLTGLVFGLGLVVAGMSDPAKVLNFLDLLGAWDPSLALFAVSAGVTVAIGYRFVLKRPAPYFARKFQLPQRTDIDMPIIVGPALFGIGWGMSGLCPGPAIVALHAFNPAILLFVLAMIAGMLVVRMAPSQPCCSQSSTDSAVGAAPEAQTQLVRPEICASTRGAISAARSRAKA